MKLTESQLFTIEALNLIEGFEWPNDGLLASANKETKHVVFWAAGHIPLAMVESGTEFDTELCKRYKQQYWNDTLITRAEFESVDGWVRACGVMPNGDAAVDIKHLDSGAGFQSGRRCKFMKWEGVKLWRYSKPQKLINQANDTAHTHNIESLIIQHKAARAAALEARRQLDAAETAERELMRDIEAWAENQGFNIRLLDERQEDPGLIITDWRDLEVK